jgi:hypothetical protein
MCVYIRPQDQILVSKTKPSPQRENYPSKSTQAFHTHREPTAGSHLKPQLPSTQLPTPTPSFPTPTKTTTTQKKKKRDKEGKGEAATLKN